MSDDPDTPLDEVPFDDPNEELFFAIAWSDRPGVRGDFADKLRRAHERGADLDGELEDGETPLTEAILGGMGAPGAVRVLLELGADASKRAASGWTPWSACLSRIADPVVSDRMQEIRSLLLEHGADRGDEHLLDFAAAVRAGDRVRVRDLLQEGIDLASPILGSLEAAVENDDPAMLGLLLEHGASPEGSDPDPEAESPLMRAALRGRMELVQRLVAAGARVERSAYDDPECTAELLARHEGHEAVADWLRGQLPEAAASSREARRAVDPKFEVLRERGTNGINYDLTTERIVEVLASWDERFGIEISEVAGDRVEVAFATLPEDLSALAREIHAFCPDVVDQGYGCMDEMVEMAEETGQEIPPRFRELVEGIDFAQEDFGLEILKRDLKAHKKLGLWWD